MKLSEMIQFLEDKKKQLGDIEFYAEKSDGRSTWRDKPTPNLVFRKQWQGHVGKPAWYLEL